MIDFEALPRTVAIVGSRSFTKSQLGANHMMREVQRFVACLHPQTQVVSGGAQGVDEWAARAAVICQKAMPKIFSPDTSMPSPVRYFARNTQIVEYVDSYDGVVVAFADERHWNGTWDTVKKAIALGVPVVILFYTQEGMYLQTKYYRFGLYRRGK